MAVLSLRSEGISSGELETKGGDLAAAQELCLHAGADARLGGAIHRADDAYAFVHLDQRHRMRNVEVRQLRVMVHGVAEDRARAPQLERVPRERMACSAGRSRRVAQRPAVAALLDQQPPPFKTFVEEIEVAVRARRSVLSG